MLCIEAAIAATNKRHRNVWLLCLNLLLESKVSLPGITNFQTVEPRGVL